MARRALARPEDRSKWREEVAAGERGHRSFLVIGFELEDRDTFRFARVGDRLVAVRHEREHRAEGAGEHQRYEAVTVLEPLPDP